MWSLAVALVGKYKESREETDIWAGPGYRVARRIRNQDFNLVTFTNWIL